MAPGHLDLFSKTILKHSGSELITWLTGRTPLQAELAPTELVVSGARILDHLVRAMLPGRPPRLHYFHIEIQSAGDRSMDRRMIAYWALAIQNLAANERKPVRLSSFVLYLDQYSYRRDPGIFRYHDEFGTGCRFTYRVVRVWKMEPDSVLRLRTPFLAPLAPLMRAADPVATVLKSKEVILQADPRVVSRRMKADLCGALSLFAGVVLKNRKLIHRIVWEDWMGLERSVIAQEWIRLGMKKGIEKGIRKGIEQGIEKGIEKGHRRGRIEALKGAILSVLKARFGRVDRALETRIQAVRNLEILEGLHSRAVVARNPKALFRKISS